MRARIMYQEEFEDIRPYYDSEISAALNRIVSVPEFRKILEFLFPDSDKDVIIQNLQNINSAIDFQKQFMHPLVCSIVNKTSKGLTTSGFEDLKPGTAYLFVANHRDIVLDSAILQVKLLDYGHQTSEITFGSNLMVNQFVIDLGKVNRMYKVYRGGNRMEFFRNSKVLSAYIRYTIREKNTSSWIAQRNGRTKDGSDRTETGLLKMFNMTYPDDFHTSFRELNILPLAISYEFEPCCAFKVREMVALSGGSVYQKQPDEDLKSIITGITQFKGRIHLAACTPVNEVIDQIDPALPVNDKINQLASLIDSTIYKNFRLWSNNFIAIDLLTRKDLFSNRYTAEEKEQFIEYMENELSLFQGERSAERKILLKMYANPVVNAGLVTDPALIADIN